MARHKMVNGIKVMFTAEEETFRDAEEATNEAAKPMNKWLDDIAETDGGMPRYLEDLITDKFDGNAGPNLQARYDEKIELRGTKP